ncbi:DNA-binding protein [Streptomyces griseorubiginosus]|uniref:nSTAND1 domain-containing NTPase n=1 Tax=Streptomyces TaxID=1883 RepID=UPI00104B03BE|nr:DNA-binding protein [Streptomyces sp. BK205]TCR18775.1 WD40 repeat protein [Streptomyces sp. BK205]
MGRRETPVDPAAGPVPRFAYELRKLRQEAGGPTYRELARRAHFSVTALSQAAAGEHLPSLQVTLAYATACGGDAGEWERRWKEAEREVREAAAGLDDDVEPPYQGLARFEPDDHDRYFGRDRLVTALCRLVRDRRFTAVFGPSGSGKSSLLRAGLIPALRAERGLAAIRVLTPGAHPARTHADALRPAGEPGPADASVAAGEPGVADASVAAGESGPAGDTLVVVDQFEEVFTLCRDPDERRAFLDLLLAAREPGSGLRVVIAVRADFYGRCAEHRGLADVLGEAGLLVGPMDPAELRDVIVKPAQGAGYIVERALTARLVDEIADEPGGLPLLSHVLRETWRRRRGRALTEEAYEAAGGVRGAIAQSAEEVWADLSPHHAELARLVLLRLITPGEGSQDTRRPIDRTELDFTAPTAGTGTPGPTTWRLGRTRTGSPGSGFAGSPASGSAGSPASGFAGSPASGPAGSPASGAAVSLGSALAESTGPTPAAHPCPTPAAHPCPTPAALPGPPPAQTPPPPSGAPTPDLGPTPDTALVLDRLVRARLLTLDHGTVDLAHEALITAWPRLSGWIEQEREQLRTHRRLTEAARAWDDLGRDPGALYRGTRLATAEEQLAGASLTAQERAFLTASSAAHRGERRRRRGLVGALAALLVLALVAGAAAWQQNRTSDRRQVEAEARRIAAVADGMRFSDPRTAMRLSVAAARLADTTETRSALIGAMAQRDEDVFAVPGADAGFDGSGNDVHRLTADGRSVVSVTADRVRIWDLRTRRLTRSVPGPGKLMDGVPAAVAPDGRTLALLAGDRVELWDVGTGRVTRTLPGVDAMQTPFAYTAHALVAVDWDDGSVHVRDPRTGRSALRLPEPAGGVSGVAASPDGRWLALCTRDGHAPELWDVTHRRRVSAPWVANARPADCRDHALAFTPDSRALTVAAADGIHGWDLRTGHATPSFTADGLTQVWPGGDGAFLVATGPHRLVVLRTAHPQVAVLSRRIDADDWDDIAFDRTAGAVRYLNGSATVVRSLALGTAPAAPWQGPTAYRAELSDDGRVLARSVETGGERRVQVLDTQVGRAGRVVFEPPATPCPRTESCAGLMALSGDGRYLATGLNPYAEGQGPPRDRTRITVWDLAHRRVHATVVIGAAPGGSLAVDGLALDTHGRTLLVYRSAARPAVEVWDVDRHQRVRTVRSVREADSVTAGSEGVRLALRSDGAALVTQEGLVADLRAGRMEPRVLGEDLISAAAYGPDGSRLAVGDVLGRVTLWDGAARARLGVLDATTSDPTTDATGGVTALAFSPDGGTLAVAGAGGTLHLWDLASQTLLGTALPTPGDDIRALAFAPDGTLHASGAHVPVLRYDLRPDRLIGEVCERAGSGLSEAAWKTYLPDLPYRRTC